MTYNLEEFLWDGLDEAKSIIDKLDDESNPKTFFNNIIRCSQLLSKSDYLPLGEADLEVCNGKLYARGLDNKLEPIVPSLEGFIKFLTSKARMFKELTYKTIKFMEKAEMYTSFLLILKEIGIFEAVEQKVEKELLLIVNNYDLIVKKYGEETYPYIKEFGRQVERARIYKNMVSYLASTILSST